MGRRRRDVGRGGAEGAVVLWLVLWACEAEPDAEQPMAASATIDAFSVVVPSDGLPPEAAPLAANNNLDVLRFEGRVWLAWRTAGTHFAGPEARMVIVSSEDEQTWRFEGEVALGTDVREPQLVDLDGTLHLYFTRLGDSPLAFTPGGVMRTTRQPDGAWTEPVDVFPEGFLAWRIKPADGRLHVHGYLGGADIYEFDGDPIEVHWAATEDGLTLSPAYGDDPVVYTGGGSESDVVRLDDGRVVAVIRNEAGDASGFGSLVCTAPAADPMAWDCVHDPRKFDSPLMLQASGRVWLVARRNVTDDGVFDLGLDELPLSEQAVRYQVAYWQEPKRCALWEVHPDTRAVDWVADLPSAGDTCFPEALDLGDGRVVLYNYTSDPERADIGWIEGQTSPTWITRQVVTLR